MQNMREMLRSSLGRSLGGLSEMERLAAAWPVACGPAMARRGVLLDFEGGILRIEVSDSAWMEQMQTMRTVLEHELARVAEVKLAGIHFELKGTRRWKR
jgi:hypothetical protein